MKDGISCELCNSMGYCFPVDKPCVDITEDGCREIRQAALVSVTAEQKAAYDPAEDVVASTQCILCDEWIPIKRSQDSRVPRVCEECRQAVQYAKELMKINEKVYLVQKGNIILTTDKKPD